MPNSYERHRSNCLDAGKSIDFLFHRARSLLCSLSLLGHIEMIWRTFRSSYSCLAFTCSPNHRYSWPPGYSESSPSVGSSIPMSMPSLPRNQPEPSPSSSGFLLQATWFIMSSVLHMTKTPNLRALQPFFSLPYSINSWFYLGTQNCEGSRNLRACNRGCFILFRPELHFLAPKAVSRSMVNIFTVKKEWLVLSTHSCILCKISTISIEFHRTTAPNPRENWINRSFWIPREREAHLIAPVHKYCI